MRYFTRAVAASLPLFLLGCSDSSSKKAGDSALGGVEVNTEWVPLSSLDNWRVYGTNVGPTAWYSTDSTIEKGDIAEDIVSRREYGDFELAWEWKLQAGGNSGFFYRATEEYDKVYWSAPEFAIVDNAGHPDGSNPLTTAGAAHSLYAPSANVVKSAGEWNSSRILVRGNHVEHYINDTLIVSYEYGSDDFLTRVAASKFADRPQFAKASRGLIGIQGDHNGEFVIKNLRIREL